MTSTRARTRTRGPLVLLEGPDGGGKTTLAEELMANGYRYVHCGPPEERALDAWRAVIRTTDGPTVIDRLHVGSFVYGRAFRGIDDLTPHERWQVDGELMAAASVIVYCRPPDEVLDANLERGPDSADAAVYEAKDKRTAVRRLYDWFFDEPDPPSVVTPEYTSDVPVVRYDFTRDDMAMTAVMVAELATGMAEQMPFVHATVRALGNIRRPRTVLVGDRTNPNLHNDEVFDSLSGRYLFTAMRTGGLTWGTTALFNSYQPDGRTLTATVLPGLGYAATADWVALGEKASRRLDSAGIKHRLVPHPQFVKRFHYKRGLVDYPLALTGERPWRS